MLLHGNPTWGFLYRKFIERLSPKYRVIAPDHAGFGRSDKPRDPRWYTLPRHIDNLGKVLDELRAERVVPVMQDWGGPIGMGWATRNPERVAGVVVMNTWAFVREPPMKLPWMVKWMVLGKGGWKRAVQGNIFVEWAVARSGPNGKLSGADLDPYRAPFPTGDDRVGIARFPQLCMKTDRMSAYQQWDLDLVAALKNEGREGLKPLKAEARSGAARFAAGKGRGGSFEDL